VATARCRFESRADTLAERTHRQPLGRGDPLAGIFGTGDARDLSGRGPGDPPFGERGIEGRKSREPFTEARQLLAGALGDAEALAHVVAEEREAEPHVAATGPQAAQAQRERPIDRPREPGEASQVQVEEQPGFESQDARTVLDEWDIIVTA
jgi:hypothetical protein